MESNKKLMEISAVIGRIGGGISYILNENDNYTIGTRRYDKKIAQYLDQTVKSWEGKEANLKKKKKGKDQMSKVAYLWKIPLTENNLQFSGSKTEV